MSNKQLKFHWDRRFIAGFTVAAFEAFAAVALLATSAYLISRASEQPPILYLMVAVVGVRAFALGRASARYLQRLLLHDSVFRSLTNLRPVLFRKLAELVPGVISSKSKALETFTSDVERLQDYPLRVLTPLLQAFAAVATMLAISLWIFPFASIALVFSAVVFLVFVLMLTSRASSNLEDKRLEKASHLNQMLLEFVANVDVLSSYGWSSSRLRKLDQVSREIQRVDKVRVLPGALAIGLLGFGAVVTASGGGALVAGSIDQVLPSVLAVAVLMPLAVFDVFSQSQSVASALRGYRLSVSRLSGILEHRLPFELLLASGSASINECRAINVEGLEIHRGNKSVLSGLSHEFSAGSLTAVVGPSGSGKSSLALCLGSLIQPTAGLITVEGQPLEKFSLESRRSKIVLIEQQPHVFRGTVRQNLEISGVVDEQQMIATLDLVGLVKEFAQRGLLEAQLSEDAGNISGGQAQRLAIARGLLAGAQVLILDEPTSGLDRANSLELMGIVRQLADRGLVVILITHDSELSELCDETLDLAQFTTQ